MKSVPSFCRVAEKVCLCDPGVRAVTPARLKHCSCCCWWCWRHFFIARRKLQGGYGGGGGGVRRHQGVLAVLHRNFGCGLCHGSAVALFQDHPLAHPFLFSVSAAFLHRTVVLFFKKFGDYFEMEAWLTASLTDIGF